MSNARIDLLEERIAWLQRHSVEQDKVMLAQGKEIDRLRADLKRLIDRLPDASDAAVSTDADPHQERPPHY
ncbi:SlyX family protein [Geminisphaera colitermitum]|uniref:SlyX family protein n=1 Tax=Geminisphaera colitermitum TaxID=1148786 RepID=UPI000158DC17|nr:SlyX family protein [Geminisphaera colitermitum]